MCASMSASMTCGIAIASTAIKREAGLRTVGALPGHQDSDTTLQYVHLCDDAVLASAQVVGDAIASREAQNA